MGALHRMSRIYKIIEFATRSGMAYPDFLRELEWVRFKRQALLQVLFINMKFMQHTMGCRGKDDPHYRNKYQPAEEGI